MPKSTTLCLILAEPQTFQLDDLIEAEQPHLANLNSISTEETSPSASALPSWSTPPKPPYLVETLWEREEIELLDKTLESLEPSPLEAIRRYRQQQLDRQIKLSNQLEDLLCQQALNLSLQEQAARWFRSQIKIEQFQKAEKEAAQVVADYAYRIFTLDRTQTDFLLIHQNSEVRIRIVILPDLFAA